MPPFRKVHEEVLAEGFRFTVARVRYETDGGDTFERDVIHHPGAVGVVPLHDDGTVTLVRQHRAALGVDLLEIPAGLRDVEGEDDATTAARELVEEAGLAAGRVERLAGFHNSAGFSDEQVAIYLATDLTEVDDDRQGPEEQAMTVERVPLDVAIGWIDDGTITDAKTVIGLGAVARRRG